MLQKTPDPASRMRAAWGVHIITALGAVAGLAAIIATSQHQWVMAFGFMGITLAIDAVDGTLARLCQVKTVLPQFSGELLDNIVDYFTYVIVPAFFVYEAGIVPERCGLFAAAIITLASGYQFCRTDAKTEDHYFTGFPSYWNIVVCYQFLLDWPAAINLVLLIALAIGVFVPIKYLYPSRTQILRPLTLVLGIAWALIVIAALMQYPHGHEPLMYASLFYIVYYFAVSFYLSLQDFRRSREEEPENLDTDGDEAPSET